MLHDTDLNMLITDPRPRELDRYYQSNSYISHTDANTTLIDKMYQTIKKRNLVSKLKLVKEFATENKKVLDIGAGTGDFLLTARQQQFSATGVEPNVAARKRASEKGVALFPDMASLPKEKYQVITLWHVLEHLPDLDEQILKLKSVLEEDGVIIVAVPNFKSYDAEHYKKFWAAYDVPRHLWHFSKTAIQKLFAKHGMKVIKIKPMIFDTFYVAILSERYKTGRSNYLKAFYVGLRSNLNAWTSKEYSSHIYIIKNA